MKNQRVPYSNPSEAIPSARAAYEISLKDLNVAYQCGEDQNLLSSMERKGKRGIMVGCRGGGCGVCKVKVLQGNFQAKKMSREHVSQDEQAAGYVLACRCEPRSDLTLEVVGNIKKCLAVGEDAKG